MANLIQIKRSLNTANATGLANGELAYSANGDVLFIGSNGGIVAIGGGRNPGTLTANQALVANSTSGIDKVIVANLVPTGVWANGAAGTGGQVLTSNSTGGVYWNSPSAGVAGSDTQIQFNDGGALAGDAGLTYNKTTDTVSITGSVLSGATVNATTLSVGNWVVANNGGVYTSGGVNAAVLSVGTAFYANTTRVVVGTSTGLQANGGIGTAGQVLHSNGTTIYWADTVADITAVTAGSGLTGGGTSGAVTIDVGAANGITVSADAIAVTGANGITVDTSGVNVRAGTDGGLSVNSTGVWVVAGSGLLTNSTGTHVGSGNGISTAADAVYVSGGSTLTVNTTGVHVNTANLVIATSQLSGDVALGTNTSGNYVATITAGNGISGSSSTEGGTPTIAVVAGTDGGLVSNSTGVFVSAGSGLVSNSTGLHVGAANGISVGADTVGLTTGSTLTVNSTGAHVNTTLSLTSLTTSGDLQVGGNLTVLGDLLTINVATLAVEDSLIQLASNNNTSDLLDIGFFGNYEAGDAGAHEHAGFFRDASDGVFKVFIGLEEAPTTTVNTAGVGYDTGTLQAWLNSGGLVSNSTAVTLTANSTLAVNLTANSLTLSTPLAVASGGIGRSSITAGAILVGNGAGATTVLAAGTDGYVLQSNGTSVVYGTLDGGTF